MTNRRWPTYLSSQLFCVYILGSGEAAEAGSVSFLLSEYSCSPPASGSVKGTDIQVHTYSLMQELALVCVWYLPNSKKILLGMLQHDKHTFKCLDSHYPYLRLSCALLVLPSLLAHLQNRNKHYAPVESTREHHRRDTVHVDISLALFIWRKVKWQHISNLQQLIFFYCLAWGGHYEQLLQREKASVLWAEHARRKNPPNTRLREASAYKSAYLGHAQVSLLNMVFKQSSTCEFLNLWDKNKPL